MSLINLPIFKTEAGVHANPAASDLYSTVCDGGAQGLLNKKFYEVFIHWTGAAWVEDAVFVPNQSIPALKVLNECEDAFAFVDYPYNDFRIAELCCIDDSQALQSEDGDNLQTEDGQNIIAE